MHLKSKRYGRYLRHLLLLVALFSSYNGIGQTFTLSFQRTPLVTALTQIEQKSDYQFIYTEELIARSVPVSFTVSNVSLDSVLRLCFREQPLAYSMEDKHIIIRKKIIEKPKMTLHEIRGRVLNEKGEPVAGITISIMNSELATATDANGDFVFINAPYRVILVVTGGEIIPQEIDLGTANYSTITVQQKVSILDESYVIAYGKSSRRLATGTVNSVKREEISKYPVSNVLSVLAGRIPGLQVSQLSGAPGSTINLQLRGINSIANGTDPLIIIDGIPYPSQALNGVIGGGAGASASPLNTLNPSDIESIEVLKDADATAIYGSRGANGVILITTVKGKAGQTSVTANFYQGFGKVTRKMKLLETGDYLQMRREAFANDGTTPTISNAQDLLLWDTTRQTDWQDVILGRTMHTTDAKLNLSGGSLQTQFSFGLGYHRETTVLPGDFGESRKTASLNLTHSSLDRRFQFSFSTSLAGYNNILPQQDLISAITLAPNAPKLYHEDGSLNWENGTWTNPLGRTRSTFETKTTNLITNITTTYKLLPSLTLKLSGGYNRLDNQDHSINPKSALNPASNPVSSAQFGSKVITTVIGEPQAEYSRRFGQHNLSLLTGSTFQQSTQSFIYQRGTGYNSDELLHSLRAASQVSVLSEGDIHYRYIGVFTRVKWDWQNKYLATFTFRRDGSSRYGEENRFSTFGSVGIGWIFINEPATQKGKLLSFGKVKGSAGITGNDQIGDYKYLDLYSPYTNSYLSTSVFYPEQLYNPTYGWEKVRKLEASLDLGMFSNRLMTTINYYHNTTTNQLVNYPVPALTGFGSIMQNIPAIIRNTGIEIELQARILEQRTIKWTTAVNLTIPRNKLISFQNLASSSYASRYAINYPLSIAKRYKWVGVDPASGTHQFKDFNNDGVISFNGDLEQVIFTGQRYFGGLQQDIKAGKWSFSVLAQFARVPSASNYLNIFSRPGRLMNQPALVLDRWRKPGDMTSVQRFSNSSSAANTGFSNYSLSDEAFSDASFVRLKNAVIAYDLVSSKSSSKAISGCQLFIKAINLFTISPYMGLDPETLTFLMPPIRTVTAGFQMTLN